MSCQITRCVINIHELLMHTSVYQVFAINCLYNGHDLMVVQPTGSGKTIIFYLLALCFKKKDPNSLIICGMPLSSIISQQAVNSLDCPVATMSMGANMRGTHIEAKGHVALTEGAQIDTVGTNSAVINDEDITNGRYLLLFTRVWINTGAASVQTCSEMFSVARFMRCLDPQLAALLPQSPNLNFEK